MWDDPGVAMVFDGSQFPSAIVDYDWGVGFGSMHEIVCYGMGSLRSWVGSVWSTQ